MKNYMMFGLIAVLVISIGGFVFVQADRERANPDLNSDPEDYGSGEFQKIILSMNGLNYNDISAEAGRPIEISADSSVSGCMRSVVFTINGKRYTQYLKTEKDVLKLPSLEKGTYTFSCTMGMGYGKLFVE